MCVCLYISHREYRPKPHLDRYEGRDLDDREYAPIEQDARAAAEAQLAERDRALGLARGRVPMALREEVSDLSVCTQAVRRNCRSGYVHRVSDVEQVPLLYRLQCGSSIMNTKTALKARDGKEVQRSCVTEWAVACNADFRCVLGAHAQRDREQRLGCPGACWEAIFSSQLCAVRSVCVWC